VTRACLCVPDGYYVASATVTPEVKKFIAGGGALPTHEQEISVAGERLLVVNYHDGTFNYKLLPLKSDGVVLEDVKLIRYPDGAVPAEPKLPSMSTLHAGM